MHKTAFGWRRVGEKPARSTSIQGRRNYLHPRPGLVLASHEPLSYYTWLCHCSCLKKVCSPLTQSSAPSPPPQPISLVRVSVHYGDGRWCYQFLPAWRETVATLGPKVWISSSQFPSPPLILLEPASTTLGCLNLLVWYCVPRICATISSKIRIYGAIYSKISTPYRLGHFLF
jgi:hypothetical protein